MTLQEKAWFGVYPCENMSVHDAIEGELGQSRPGVRVGVVCGLSSYPDAQKRVMQVWRM